MIDARVIDRLVAEAGLDDHPLVLEVGPGTGVLTEALLDAGAPVVAVEIDSHLADLLGERLGDRLTLIAGDALAGKHELNADMVAELAGGDGRPVRLVANLPYNIASPLVAELIGSAWKSAAGGSGAGLPIDRLVFTVQREVADRLDADAGTKDYGPLSVVCQGLGEVSVPIGRISPNAFYPKPNVHSALVRIDLPAATLRQVSDLAILRRWLDVGFGHRRKSLSASIKLLDSEWRARLTTAALAVGIDLQRRGETLTVEEYLELSEAT
jgi:16S rRNA (adenine1518-N6/adenine1519-N6)-dimethyltransferase